MWKPRQDDAFQTSWQDLAGSVPLFFWGTSLTFPDWILRTVEAEASAGQSIRIKSLDEVRRCMQRLSPEGPAQACAVFFDDTVADDVFSHFGAISDQVEVRNWIFAYRDPALAQRLLTARQTDPDLARILLLPMNVPISCWTPMLHLVLAGNFFVPGDLLCASDPAPEPKSANPCSAATTGRLTRREEEVLALVAKGGRNKAIAHMLSLSEHTVKLHLHHAISKIGARNRTEAANWYLTRQHSEQP